MTVSREVEFGIYLKDEEGKEVLLPSRYVPEGVQPGAQLRVFVYTDSDDRPVATTETPFATVGEFAYLQVRDVNDTGAFLDWGLPKDLLVPYSQQKAKMTRGGIYLVYVYLDDASSRVVASAKIEKFIGNAYPDYTPGDKVKALVTEHTPIGYRVIVNNRHWGMIYDNEITHPIEIEQYVTAYVKGVRDDGKLDLTIADRAARRSADLAKTILNAIASAPEHKLNITDDSTPEQIRQAFGCSKKDFKKAVGHLYKQNLILLGNGYICLAQ